MASSPVSHPSADPPSDHLPLIHGTKLLCPRCEIYHDVLWYERWGEIEAHADETNPIYRCSKRKGGCGWIFSPAEHSVLHSIYGTRLRPLDAGSD